MPVYPRNGNYEIIPLADAQNLVSQANLMGDNRVVYESAGKQPGKLVLIDLDGTQHALCIATGSKSSDTYARCDGGAVYTPVNMNPATAGFTVGTNSVFTSTTGVLTTTGLNAVTDRAFQTVALKAGNYRFEAEIGGIGASAASYKTARVRVTSGAVTAGVGATLLTTVIGSSFAINASAAASAPKDLESVKFNLPADGNVTFVLDVVDQAAALASGTAYLKITKLEGINAL